MQEYFIEAYQSKGGSRTYKLTKNGRGMRASVNLYLDGELVKVYQDGVKNARKAGREHIRKEV